MAFSNKTILLSYPHVQDHDQPGTSSAYRVEKVTNSTDYVPGQILDKAAVDELCRSTWDVTMSQKRA
jgi:hypothetical protein